MLRSFGIEYVVCLSDFITCAVLLRMTLDFRLFWSCSCAQCWFILVKCVAIKELVLGITYWSSSIFALKRKYVLLCCVCECTSRLQQQGKFIVLEGNFRLWGCPLGFEEISEFKPFEGGYWLAQNWRELETNVVNIMVVYWFECERLIWCDSVVIWLHFLYGEYRCAQKCSKVSIIVKSCCVSEITNLSKALSEWKISSVYYRGFILFVFVRWPVFLRFMTCIQALFQA